MKIPLEDLFEDVIGKARRGLRLSEAQLAQKAGLSLRQVEAVAHRPLDEGVIAKVAAALDLEPGALLELARQSWHPGEVTLPRTFAAFNVPFSDMTVNFYLAWDRDGGRAAAFDTGTDCAPMLEALRAHRLTLDAIFLTHTHGDHVAELDLLVSKTGAPVYVSRFEPFEGASPIEDGRVFEAGGLKITAKLTPGHSPGGMTYVIEGLEPKVAVVGDALFSASMGGVPPEGYAAALRANRTNILGLPDDTVICAGHGPMTTVGLEKKHNAFYAA